MSTREELLAAVLAHPEDDEPRLIYADWLLEQGDPRGELIVIQCKRARGDRSDELVQRFARLASRHTKEWIGYERAQLPRGFVETMDFFDPANLDAMNALVLREPIQRLVLRSTQPDLIAAAAEWEGLRTVREVTITSSSADVVLDSARRLGGLGFAHYSRISPLLRALGPNVRALRLMGFDLGAETFEGVRAPIERLFLEACKLRGAHLADRVFGSETARRLRGLGLSHNPIGGDAWRIGELAGEALTELTLGSIGLDASGLRALLASGVGPRLRHLDLGNGDALGAPPVAIHDRRSYDFERRQNPNPLAAKDLAPLARDDLHVVLP